MLGSNDGDKKRLKTKIVSKFLLHDVIGGNGVTVEAAQHWFVEDEHRDVRKILRDQARLSDEDFPLEGERSAGEIIVYVPSDRVTEAFKYAKSNRGVFSDGMDDADETDDLPDDGEDDC